MKGKRLDSPKKQKRRLTAEDQVLRWVADEEEHTLEEISRKVGYPALTVCTILSRLRKQGFCVTRAFKGKVDHGYEGYNLQYVYKVTLAVRSVGRPRKTKG